MIYVVSGCAMKVTCSGSHHSFHSEHIPFLVRHIPFLVRGDSLHEAFGKATQFVKVAYPPEDGWQNHHVIVMPYNEYMAIDDPSDAKIMPAPISG